MPDPSTIALATAVATGTVAKIAEVVSQATIDDFKSFRKTVFRYFRGDPEAQEALDEALLEPDDEAAITAVAGHLERAAEAEPEIRRFMDALAAQPGQVTYGPVVNRADDVSGTVIQVGHVHGGNVHGSGR
ncbi:hypothetical protein KIK06_17825 [Nocardiopsis sp. EMB25]|uniref:hypothetical protein n=1 Tax=Nocardiopsis TaxID=2013 RepID=UPI00034865A5|nr:MULTISPECIES: hypothetical protein [Nocardiopsis]MCY9785749.1 hypothetical protein [Nocardiopsis sp. EMB25]